MTAQLEELDDPSFDLLSYIFIYMVTLEVASFYEVSNQRPHQRRCHIYAVVIGKPDLKL